MTVYFNRKIKVYCIEFKYETLSVENIIAQLNASLAWCQTLNNTIQNYINKKRTLYLTKYVISCHNEPGPYLDRELKYLARDHSIRHYLYDDIDGMNLEELDNSNVDEIR